MLAQIITLSYTKKTEIVQSRKLRLLEYFVYLLDVHQANNYFCHTKHHMVPKAPFDYTHKGTALKQK